MPTGEKATIMINYKLKLRINSMSCPGGRPCLAPRGVLGCGLAGPKMPCDPYALSMGAGDPCSLGMGFGRLAHPVAVCQMGFTLQSLTIYWVPYGRLGNPPPVPGWVPLIILPSMGRSPVD